MFVNLWYINLFLIAHVLIILALASYTWLYIDLYIQERKDFVLYRIFGNLLLLLSFVANLLFSINNELSFGIKLEVILLQTAGLLIIYLSNLLEPVPGLPKLSNSKKSKKLAVNPVVFFILSIVNFVFSLGIAYQTYRKFKFGLSKEFKLLVAFWLSLSLFLFIQSLTIIGQEELVWLDVLTRRYSTLWVFSQIVLLASALILFRWIATFISFRIFAKVFFSIWQLSIGLSILLASLYSIFTISSSENQLFELLDKNASLVSFNIEQIKVNNEDLLEVLSKDTSLISLVNQKDVVGIQDRLDVFLADNQSFDNIFIVNRSGILVFDRERPTASDLSFSNNSIIKEVLTTTNPKSSYTSEQSTVSSDVLVFQSTYPLKNELGEVIGLISTVKRFDDNYLDLLKSRTDQEIILYVNNRRSASTIISEDEISRLENLPLVKNDSNFEEIEYDSKQNEANITFARTRIATIPYYAAILNLSDSNAQAAGELIVATKQISLIETTQSALINTFAIAILLSVLATVPSYYLAKSIKRSFA